MLLLSQSAVSAALTNLEQQLKVKLFDRVGKPLVLNEYGRLLYPRAVALLEQAGEINTLFSQENGALRLFASSTIGNYIQPELIAGDWCTVPGTQLWLQVGNSEEVINAVADFRVDMGLIEKPGYHPDLVDTRLAQ